MSTIRILCVAVVYCGLTAGGEVVREYYLNICVLGTDPISQYCTSVQCAVPNVLGPVQLGVRGVQLFWDGSDQLHLGFNLYALN